MSKQQSKQAKEIGRQDEPKIQKVRSEHYQAVYTNNAQLASSPWDVQLTFGEVTPSPSEDGSLTRKDLVTIIMSPQHAKALLLALAGYIKQYEAQYGQLNIAPALKPQPPQS